MAKTKSMQRSLAQVKEYGWLYQITEHWNPYVRRREDLWGFCDIQCLDGKRTIAIQATGADIASHRTKILENEFVIPWLTGVGNELQIWSWRKLKKVRGKKATYWNCNITDVLISQGAVYFEEQKKEERA